MNLSAQDGFTLPPAGIIIAAAGGSEAIEKNKADIAALTEQNEGIVAAALEKGEEVSDADLETIEANNAKIGKLNRIVSALEGVADLSKPAGRQTLPEPQNTAPGQRQRVEPRIKDPKAGFKSLGDFCQCVKAATVNNDAAPAAIAKLQNAATTWSSEGTGADGGWAVPPDFRREIAEKVAGENSLLGRTDQIRTQSNFVVQPVDETTPWQSTGGLQAFWESEGGAISQSKVALDMQQIRLNKLTALAYVTDELLEDAPGLDAYLRRKVPMKMVAKTNTAIISGTGVGQPLGVLNSGALVSVAKETSQAADTIYFENIVNMVARFYVSDESVPVWLINQNTLPQLMAMKFDRSATSPVPVWLPANGLAGQRFSTLMGWPVIPVQACPKLGDLGDIILADLMQYRSIVKGPEVRTDVSIHVEFEKALTAFRFIMRIAGQPMWAAPITPQNATETLGSFVALAERA